MRFKKELEVETAVSHGMKKKSHNQSHILVEIFLNITFLLQSHVAPIFKIFNLSLLWLKICLIGSQEAQKAIFSKSHFAPKMAPAAILTFLM